MANEVNMYYRFTSDNEPTDEQLLTLMKEVQADVHRENETIKKIMAENIQREYANARAMFPDL
jgi:hypothetical protein